MTEEAAPSPAARGKRTTDEFPELPVGSSLPQDIRAGLRFGALAGAAAGLAVFGMCYFMSTMPAITDVSLTWVFRPWWRLSNLVAAIIAFALVGVVVGVMVAYGVFRQELRDGRKKRKP